MCVCVCVSVLSVSLGPTDMVVASPSHSILRSIFPNTHTHAHTYIYTHTYIYDIYSVDAMDKGLVTAASLAVGCASLTLSPAQEPQHSRIINVQRGRTEARGSCEGRSSMPT